MSGPEDEKVICLLTITVRIRWWLSWYLKGVSLASQLTGLEPNWEKVEKWLRRGVYIAK